MISEILEKVYVIEINTVIKSSMAEVMERKGGQSWGSAAISY